MAFGIHEDIQSDGSILYKIGHNPTDAKTTMGYKTEADAEAALANHIGLPVVEEESVASTQTVEPVTGDQA